MALYLDVGPEDVLRIGNDLVVSVERKSGARARLKFEGTERVVLEKGGKAPKVEDDERGK